MLCMLYEKVCAWGNKAGLCNQSLHAGFYFNPSHDKLYLPLPSTFFLVRQNIACPGLLPMLKLEVMRVVSQVSLLSRGEKITEMNIIIRV